MADPANTRLDHQITGVTSRPSFTEPSISLEFENDSDSTVEHSSLASLHDSSHINQSPQDFEREITSRKKQSNARFKSKWEEILSKYSQIDDEKESDEIDLFTGEIITDNGHLKSLLSNDTTMRGVPVQHNIWSGSDTIERDLLKNQEWKNVRAKRELKEKLKKDQNFHFQHTPSPEHTSPKKQAEVPEDNLILVKPSPTKRSRKSSPVKRQRLSPVGKIDFFEPSVFKRLSDLNDESPSKISFNALSLCATENESPTKKSRPAWMRLDNGSRAKESSVIVADDSTSEPEDSQTLSTHEGDLSSAREDSEQLDGHSGNSSDEVEDDDSADDRGQDYDTPHESDHESGRFEYGETDHNLPIKREETYSTMRDYENGQGPSKTVAEDGPGCPDAAVRDNRETETPTLSKHRSLQDTIFQESDDKLESDLENNISSLSKAGSPQESGRPTREPSRRARHEVDTQNTKEENPYLTRRSNSGIIAEEENKKSSRWPLAKNEYDDHDVQHKSQSVMVPRQKDRRIGYDEKAIICIDKTGSIRYIRDDQTKSTERFRCALPRCTYSNRGELKYRGHLLRSHQHELRLIGYPVRVESTKPVQVDIPEAAIINLLQVFPLVHNLPNPLRAIELQEVANKVFTCPVLGCRYSTPWGYNGMKQHFELTQHHIPPSSRKPSSPFSRQPKISASFKLPTTSQADSFSSPSKSKSHSRSYEHLQKEINEMFSDDENVPESPDSFDSD